MINLKMYIDESGCSNILDENKYFVLTGLVVNERADFEVSAYFKYMKRRHKLDENVSLHAYDMFEDPKSRYYLNDEKCKSFTASVAEFIENAPFTIMVYYINKQDLLNKVNIPEGYKFKGTKNHKADKEIAYEINARKLFFEFGAECKKQKAVGHVVAESRQSMDNILLDAYLDSKSAGKYKFKMYKNKAKLVTEYVHSIGFANKRCLMGGLELADIISYCTYNEMSSTLINRPGMKRMWGIIKTQLKNSTYVEITPRTFTGLADDRINEIHKRIQGNNRATQSRS